MAFQAQGTGPNGQVSPGGFEFGLQGWSWPAPVPKSITFFLDGTAMVCDQFGRPIRGSSVDGKEVFFAVTPPQQDAPPKATAKLGTHAQVVAALTAEGVKWRDLTWAGWPQLPYAELKKLDPVPPTPVSELRKIHDPDMRKDALRIRREVDTAAAAELKSVEDEVEESVPTKQ